VIEELGKADASTGWVVNQLAIYGTYASRMPRKIAKKIWIDTPHGCVANTPAATATAVVVPGGYRVTGPARDSAPAHGTPRGSPRTRR